VVPAGMTFVTLDGTTVNATPLQLVVFCGAIDGIGFNVTVKVKGTPVQFPLIGVIV